MLNLKKIAIFTCTILLTVISLPANAGGWGQTTFQSANFHDFDTGLVAQPSAGTLTRTKHSVRANLALSGLDLGAAYTVWWVIWNNPKQCASNPCGMGDLGVPGNVAIYATGFVTGESGAMSVVAELSAGKLPSGMYVHPGIPGVLQWGRGQRAEIHMLVESHGSILPGSVDIQISEDLGACNITCVIQQGIAFMPTK
jgi:hypothetical protein